MYMYVNQYSKYRTFQALAAEVLSCKRKYKPYNYVKLFKYLADKGDCGTCITLNYLETSSALLLGVQQFFVRASTPQSHRIP